MYESLNYAKRKYSNEATDEWDSAVEGVVKHQMRHCTPATRKSSKP